jgi:hypothetical protein
MVLLTTVECEGTARKGFDDEIQTLKNKRDKEMVAELMEYLTTLGIGNTDEKGVVGASPSFEG